MYKTRNIFSCCDPIMPKSAGTHETTPQLRKIICDNASAGKPLRDIADFTNIPLRTVQSIVLRGSKRGHNENAPRSGRPSKLDDRTLRHAKIHIYRDRRQPLTKITDLVNETIPSPVHPSTVRTGLNSYFGLSIHVAAKKPFINITQRKKRLNWAKKHRALTMVDWERVIWTDEASVEVGKESRQCLVWRRPGERYREECLVPTFKSGRQSLMIWGCISYGRRGPLVRIPSDRRKGVDYVQLVLSGPLWEFYVERFNEMGGAVVMEDGAPIHRSRAAQDFRDQNSMETLPHPPQSPDLNPIEHVWKRLKTMVNKCLTRSKNAEELWVALQEEWVKIDIEFINSLIESMPRRAQAVYEVQGKSTKY
jgi:transposase